MGWGSLIRGSYATQALKGLNDQQNQNDQAQARQIENQMRQEQLSRSREERPYYSEGLRRQNELSQMQLEQARRAQYEAKFDRLLQDVYRKYVATGDPQIIADAMTENLKDGHRYFAVTHPNGNISFGDETGIKEAFKDADEFFARKVMPFRNPNYMAEHLKSKQVLQSKMQEELWKNQLDTNKELQKIQYKGQIDARSPTNEMKNNIYGAGVTGQTQGQVWQYQHDTPEMKNLRANAKNFGISEADMWQLEHAKDQMEFQKAMANAKSHMYDTLLQNPMIAPGSKEFNEAMANGTKVIESFYTQRPSAGLTGVSGGVQSPYPEGTRLKDPNGNSVIVRRGQDGQLKPYPLTGNVPTGTTVLGDNTTYSKPSEAYQNPYRSFRGLSLGQQTEQPLSSDAFTAPAAASSSDGSDFPYRSANPLANAGNYGMDTGLPTWTDTTKPESSPGGLFGPSYDAQEAKDYWNARSQQQYEQKIKDLNDSKDAFYPEIPGYAQGGYIPGGQLAEVGEDGQEVYIPTPGSWLKRPIPQYVAPPSTYAMRVSPSMQRGIIFQPPRGPRPRIQNPIQPVYASEQDVPYQPLDAVQSNMVRRPMASDPVTQWKMDNYAKMRREQDAGYDLEGYVNKYGIPDQSGGKHLTDEFKLPNHMTFSNESRYSTPEQEGGQWRKEGNTWHFYASPFNVQTHGAQGLRDYVYNREPNVVLHLPGEETGYARAIQRPMPSQPQESIATADNALSGEYIAVDRNPAPVSFSLDNLKRVGGGIAARLFKEPGLDPALNYSKTPSHGIDQNVPSFPNQSSIPAGEPTSMTYISVDRNPRVSEPAEAHFGWDNPGTLIGGMWNQAKKTFFGGLSSPGQPSAMAGTPSDVSQYQPLAQSDISSPSTWSGFGGSNQSSQPVVPVASQPPKQRTTTTKPSGGQSRPSSAREIIVTRSGPEIDAAVQRKFQYEPSGIPEGPPAYLMESSVPSWRPGQNSSYPLPQNFGRGLGDAAGEATNSLPPSQLQPWERDYTSRA